MNTASTFSEYARSSDLSPDETYTVEILIDRVRNQFDPKYWDDWSERMKAREIGNYQPSFSLDHIEPAAKELASLSWVSLQRLSDRKRPVRDITALRFFPGLSSVILINNQVSDLTPICSCSELRRLDLYKNPIQDISPLAHCTKLENLVLGECPIVDFSVLQTLPNLREISISVDQIDAFKKLKRLPNVRKIKIEFGSGPFESFEGFPEMPELRVIWGAHVKKLNGIQRYRKLQNLVNLSGTFSTLEPLSDLRELTHVNILRSRASSLQPLAGLPALCDLFVSTDRRKLDLSPLMSISSLHEVNVRCGGKEPAGLEMLQASLSPWDIEFRASKPRHSPSLELQIVDQQTFDTYDTNQPFNVGNADYDEGLLSSELDWLDKQLKKLFASELLAEDEYAIPFHWNGARSRTIVLYSEASVASFSKLVLGIQNILSNAKQDWIIYLHTDGVHPDFIVWVYPDKIMVTHEHAEAVRRLIELKDRTTEL